MNIAILKGNVGQEPKIKTFKEGGKIAEFSLATTERGFTTRDGHEIKPRTDWHSIVVRQSGLAGIVEKYVHKGTPVLVQGKICYRTYEDNSGQTRYVTEIVAEDIELLSSGEKKSDYKPADDYPDEDNYR